MKFKGKMKFLLVRLFGHLFIPTQCRNVNLAATFLFYCVFAFAFFFLSLGESFFFVCGGYLPTDEPDKRGLATCNVERNIEGSFVAS